MVIRTKMKADGSFTSQFEFLEYESPWLGPFPTETEAERAAVAKAEEYRAVTSPPPPIPSHRSVRC
jgi:hypothetical protein